MAWSADGLEQTDLQGLSIEQDAFAAMS